MLFEIKKKKQQECIGNSGLPSNVGHPLLDDILIHCTIHLNSIFPLDSQSFCYQAIGSRVCVHALYSLPRTHS